MVITRKLGSSLKTGRCGVDRSAVGSETHRVNDCVTTRSTTLLGGGSRNTKIVSVQNRCKNGLSGGLSLESSIVSGLQNSQALSLELHQCVQVRKAVSRLIDARHVWWERIEKISVFGLRLRLKDEFTDWHLSPSLTRRVQKDSLRWLG